MRAPFQFDVPEISALPGWLGKFAAVTRPLAVTLTVAVPAIGAASVGIVSFFDPERGAHMAVNSAGFLRALPDALYWLVGGIAVGYSASKSAEVIGKPAAPAGSKSPEAALTAPEGEPSAAGDEAGIPDYARG